MPKRRNITAGELTKALLSADDVIDDLHAINHDAEQGRIDLPPEPMSAIRTLTSLARAALNLQSALLGKLALEEQKRELEQLVRADKARDAAAGKATK